MRRHLALAYGTLCYLIFFGTFLYLVGFLANVGVPRGVDGPVSGSVLGAVAIDVGLILLFGLQHTVMARPGFKAWWTRFVPRPVERSTYVLLTSLTLWALFAFWQPLPGALWTVDAGPLRTALLGLYAAGVGMVLYSTLLIDHFDLFGLRQVFLYWRRRECEEKRFVTPSLYRWIRHPLYVGWFVTFWATPDMTTSHLFLATLVTVYVLAAIPYEERDLATALGESYRRWHARTPAFFPKLGGEERVARPLVIGRR